VVVCRYPSRRTFLKLASDPSYAPIEPYKFMALEIDLVPVSGDMLVPDLRLIDCPVVIEHTWLIFPGRFNQLRISSLQILKTAGTDGQLKNPIYNRGRSDWSNIRTYSYSDLRNNSPNPVTLPAKGFAGGGSP
jgi:hypothetical protein